MFAMAHQGCGRCDDLRRARLSDIIRPDKITVVGPADCHLVTMMINGGKANKTGKPEYMGMMRNKHVECCAVNALMELLFMTYTVKNAPMEKIGTPAW